MPAKAKPLVTLPIFPVELVPLDKIFDDGRNPRLPSRDDAHKIAELVESFKLDGLMQPILVFPAGGKFHLVYGNRRVAAAREAAWKKIPAMVMDHAPDDAERERKRAVENLNRDNLNDAEEVLLVLQMVEARGGDAERAAADLGRPIRWLRDRLYLQKLTTKVRDLLAAGELKLGQAREIVKWGDPRDQVRVAARILDEQKIGGPVSIEEVQNWLEEERQPLKSVAWNLDTPFAGKPRCSDCQFNSSVNVGLFGPIKKGGDAYCSLPACYQAKKDRSGAEQAKAQESLRSRVKEKKISAESAVSLEVAREIAPPWMKPEALQASIVGVMPTAATPAAKKPPAAPSAPNAPTERERRQAAVIEWANEFRKWRASVIAAVIAAGKVDARKKVCFMLLQFSEPLTKHPAYWAPYTAFEFARDHKNSIAPAEEAPASPALARLLTCIAAGTYDGLLELAEAVKGDWEECDKLADQTTGPQLTLAIAKAFEVRPTPPPGFDIFLPQDLRPKQSEETPATAGKRNGADAGAAKPVEFAYDSNGWINTVLLPDARVKVAPIASVIPGTFKANIDCYFGRGSAAVDLTTYGICSNKIYPSKESAVLAACEVAEDWLLTRVSVSHKKDREKIAAVLEKLGAFMAPLRGSK